MFEYEIIVDHNETKKQCTILPLSDRPDFLIRRYKPNKPLSPLNADVLLHPEGTPLNLIPNQNTKTLAALDCIWRRLEAITNSLKPSLPTLVSIPEGFVTAYPRKSRDGSDPTAGLATIEALFIAAAFLGQWDQTLLDKYYFKDSFLEKNRHTFAKYHLGP